MRCLASILACALIALAAVPLASAGEPPQVPGCNDYSSGPVKVEECYRSNPAPGECGFSVELWTPVWNPKVWIGEHGCT